MELLNCGYFLLRGWSTLLFKLFASMEFFLFFYLYHLDTILGPITGTILKEKKFFFKKFFRTNKYFHNKELDIEIQFFLIIFIKKYLKNLIIILFFQI